MSEDPQGLPPGTDPDRVAQLRAAMASMQFPEAQQPPPGWRPWCASCANNQKVAVIELASKLQGLGLAEGSQEFAQVMQKAAMAGQAVARGQAIGMNGTKPDLIPPVNQADVMVGGTGLCLGCLPAQKQTSLLVGTPGWPPKF